ncbi:hypothetical protein MANES_02G068201v8 [Manihot esculenta]|uniref:Uncharacterized protein n=1 Tax=Manihot esculenta TaxID=3983 RepID=A0ACB7I686_MANES|nr:hypothetical protein MANES_02G068201v8 [Manihot esculenta]
MYILCLGFHFIESNDEWHFLNFHPSGTILYHVFHSYKEFGIILVPEGFTKSPGKGAYVIHTLHKRNEPVDEDKASQRYGYWGMRHSFVATRNMSDLYTALESKSCYQKMQS